MWQDPVGHCDTHDKQRGCCRGKGERGIPFLLLQAGHDEGPQLVDPDRSGEDQAQEQRCLEHEVERSHHRSEVDFSPVLAHRGNEKAKDVVVQEEPADGAQHQGNQ